MTRYFIRLFAVFGSAANQTRKWSFVRDEGLSPFTPSRLGAMPLIAGHAVTSGLVDRVGSTSVGAVLVVDVVVEVVDATPVIGSTVVVVVVTSVVVVVSPVRGSLVVVVVVVVVVPVVGSVVVVVVVVVVGPVAGAELRLRHASLRPVETRPFSVSSSAESCMRIPLNLDAGAGRPLPHAAVSASSATAIRL